MRPEPVACVLLLVASLGAAACHRQAAGAGEAPESSRGLKVEHYDPPTPQAPVGEKLETMKPHPEGAPAPAISATPPAVPPAPAQPQASAPADPFRPAATAPAAPRVTEPGRDLYDAAPPTPAPEPPAAPGFRITLPVCRRAETQGDPLARTPECAQMLAIAREQQRLCAKAFEEGDDAVVLSPACRQAARGR